MTDRLMYWAPWSVTRPWLPRWFRGGDEWGNPSFAIVLPGFLGCVILFYAKDFNREGHPTICNCEDCDRRRTP